MRGGRWRTLPGGVWAMGFGSLLMDLSSEMIHSLLPALMVTALGASMTTVGLLEGAAEATAAVVKVFSGALSDLMGRRKTPMILGYALSACSKPVFPLAGSIQAVFAARFADRVGKGMRGAPRDALIADITHPLQRGAAYGLRQALDSVGALLGPLAAVLLMLRFSDDIRRTMWLAAVPALGAVALLAVFVREPERGAGSALGKRVSFASAGRLPARFWLVVLLGAVFTLARFSEAFLVLRAQSVGLPLHYVPLVMIAMNAVYAGGAYPAGAAADRVSPRALLALGLAALMAADVALAFAAAPAAVFAGSALWGLHMALTQGLLSKLVADAAPADLLGTGFGIFNLVSGGALLLASLIAGSLWSAYGPAATFLASAGFAAASAAGLLGAGRRR